MSYLVYMHTNLINNKKYIGITGQTAAARWSNGKGYKLTTYFGHAINKYGWDNFSHEILYEGLTKEDACKLEIELIKKYHSNERDYGYNNSTGGEINVGFHHTEEAKKKMSEANKKRPVNYLSIEKMRKANQKKVRCIELDRIFNSITEANKELNIHGKHIGECCKGKRKTCGGYHWEYVN